jgi:hypothetical protein
MGSFYLKKNLYAIKWFIGYLQTYPNIDETLRTNFNQILKEKIVITQMGGVFVLVCMQMDRYD